MLRLFYQFCSFLEIKDYYIFTCLILNTAYGIKKYFLMFLNEQMSVLQLPTIFFLLKISTFAEWIFTIVDTEMMSLDMFLVCS